MPKMYQGRFGRAIAGMSQAPWFAKVGPKVVPRIDRLVHRLTNGRRTMSGGMVPVLMLTTTGRKTGKERTTPLATMPQGDAFYVLGSNFGRENDPAWSLNLLANPEATVSFRGRTIPVHATVVDDEERTALWPQVLKYWPGYHSYVERSGRQLRLFRLVPR